MQTIHKTQTASLKTFMSNIIDYAGLFPPAKLALDKAFQNYVKYQQGADQWMLSRFIIPATKLDQLTPLIAANMPSNKPFRFSILGRGGLTTDAFLSGLEADLQAVVAFRERFGEKVETDLFEGRLPNNILEHHNANLIQDILMQAADLFVAQGGMTQFYEVPAGLKWAETAQVTIEAIANYNNQRVSTNGHLSPNHMAFKLRCGGVEASAFPSPEMVAFIIASCCDAGVALKATAGLHHPIRHFNESVQTKMHGFLNVFGAGILAQVHKLNKAEIQTIIEDETAKHFSFTETEFSWQHLKATLTDISTARNQAVISYGSCSFDEPREDLQTLGLAHFNL